MEYNPANKPEETPEKRVLYVTDADIDIARMIIDIDRMDGRPSDEATWRIANAQPAPEQE